MTINERLVKLRKSLKIKQGEFAQKIGMKQSTLSTMELGNSPVSDRYIKLICLTFHVSEQWLRSGEGEMSASEDPDTEEFLEIYRRLSPPFRKMLLEYGRFLIEQQALMPPSCYVSLD